jgi:glutamyl-tRNA reductase
MRRQGEAERDRILTRARALLAQGRSPEQALEFLAHTLTGKLLHAPSTNLRQAALRGDRELLQAAAKLYDLDAPEGGGSGEGDSHGGAAR